MFDRRFDCHLPRCRCYYLKRRVFPLHGGRARPEGAPLCADIVNQDDALEPLDCLRNVEALAVGGLEPRGAVALYPSQTSLRYRLGKREQLADGSAQVATELRRDQPGAMDLPVSGLIWRERNRDDGLEAVVSASGERLADTEGKGKRQILLASLETSKELVLGPAVLLGRLLVAIGSAWVADVAPVVGASATRGRLLSLADRRPAS
jgi:hypothetical protein